MYLPKNGCRVLCCFKLLAGDSLDWVLGALSLQSGLGPKSPSLCYASAWSRRTVRSCRY